MRGGTVVSGDRGTSTLELVIWAPILLLIVSVIIYAGRVAQARQTVEAAAGEAARAATAVPSRWQAEPAARSAATAALTSAGMKCSSVFVSVDTSDWNTTAPGQPGAATAQVRCQVVLADLFVPGMPGSLTATGTGRSVLDTYRSRG